MGPSPNTPAWPSASSPHATNLAFAQAQPADLRGPTAHAGRPQAHAVGSERGSSSRVRGVGTSPCRSRKTLAAEVTVRFSTPRSTWSCRSCRPLHLPTPSKLHSMARSLRRHLDTGATAECATCADAQGSAPHSSSSAARQVAVWLAGSTVPLCCAPCRRWCSIVSDARIEWKRR